MQQKGAEVSYHDPHCPTVTIGEHQLKSVPFDNLDKYDCVVVVTDHSAVDYKSVAAKAKIIVDTRNALKNVKADAKAKLITL